MAINPQPIGSSYGPNPTVPPPAPTTGTVAPVTDPLTKDQQDAFDLLSATLTSWGLTDLAADLRKLIVAGNTNPDTLALALSQTDAYKTRFKGNDARRAAGLPELQPAQYIALEEQYSNILKSYGLPPGFYDSHDDFTKFIGNDLSPAELDARAKIAHDQYIAAPSYVKDLWTQYFGGPGDAIALILDPNTATSVIQDRATQVGIGGAAAAQGLGVSQARAQDLQQRGVTLAGAQKAYQDIAQAMPTDQAIAQRFGTAFDQSDEENDLLLGNAEATTRRQTLYDEEQGLFRSRVSQDSNSIGVSQQY